MIKIAYASPAAYNAGTGTGESVRYAYNLLDGSRKSATRTALSGSTVTTAYAYYGYDVNGNPTPDFRQGQLKSVTTTSGGVSRVISYDYDLLGNKISMTTPSGKSIGYAYDVLNRLSTVTHPDGAVTTFGYDKVGNRQSVTRTTSATAAPFSTTGYAYDQDDRITSESGSGGGAHSYDLDGNEQAVSGQAAGYDFENHLVRLGNGTASYVYDADGNRVSVSSAGTTTSYVVDASLPYASVVEEYSGTSTVPSARYDYGDDLVRMDRGSGVYYYLYDGLGSTRQLVSTAGAVTDSYGYSAFEEMASHTGSTQNPFLFNAQQFDQASGDYYLRARYYDQTSGRFLSQDPFEGVNGDPISLHRYLYVGDDPVDRVDPLGMYDGIDHKNVELGTDPEYSLQHPDDTEVTFGKLQYYFTNGQGWAGFQRYVNRNYGPGTTPGLLANPQKPDIFNPNEYNYMDYKSLSVGGKSDAIKTLRDYADAYGPKPGIQPFIDWFYPDNQWVPPLSVFGPLNGKKYWLYADGSGIIYYEGDQERKNRISSGDNGAFTAILALGLINPANLNLALPASTSLAASGASASAINEEAEEGAEVLVDTL